MTTTLTPTGDRGLLGEARAILNEVGAVDLHVDSFIGVRLFGYDITRAHPLLTGGAFFGHVDLPRAKDGRLVGALWSITTNPLRSAKGRLRALQENVRAMRALATESGGAVALVTSAHAYDEARARGAHALIPVVQGANCLGAARDFTDALGADLADFIVAATLVHLVSSDIGETSTPVVSRFGPRGITARGRDLVERLNATRVFVDLAHASPATFWGAMDVHAKDLPALVTHTGVKAKNPLWRNVDDDQIRAIANTGGVLGVIFHADYLKWPGAPDDVELVVEHLAHLVNVGGEDCAALGSDWDGAVVPPKGLEQPAGLELLVVALLKRKWTHDRVRKILSANFLRCFRVLRP